MMGAAGDPWAVFAAGRATGAYLRARGVGVDLAPVLDVAESSFLGSRTFGGDPALVARVGPAFGQGLQAARVAATAKHFPGLGTATANTDLSVVAITTGRAELERRLAPFRRAVRSGTKLVMVSNAVYPALDPSGLPAVLSPAIVTGLLRKRLGFHGVVITDSLTTPAPRAHSDAATRAIEAGVDLLLYSDDAASSETAFATLRAAAVAGTLDAERLAAAYRRVLALKRWVGRSAR